MIAKIKKRADFGGIVNYAHNNKSKEKRATLLAYKDVCIVSNKTIADSFELQKVMHSPIAAPVRHVSLAFSPEDIQRFPENGRGDALMVEIAEKWMKKMGVHNTQYIIARHYDTDHPHCHLVYNRIDNNGNVISDSREFQRNVQVCKELTAEYGLYFAPRSRKVKNGAKLRPDQLKKANLKSSVYDALSASRSWDDFKAELKQRNIDCRFNYAKGTEEPRGISFCNGEVSIAGSRLGGDLGFNSLCGTLGNLAVEVILQPHQAPLTSGGGGSDNDRGWRDEDKERENKITYNPYKRRR